MPIAQSSPDRNLYHYFWKLAGVNIISNLMVPLAGLTNIAFLGHLQDIHYLAGVALATVLFNYLYWSFGFLRMGTTGTTAQCVGRDDWDGVILTGLRNAALALGFGLAILILQYPLREIGFAVLSADTLVKQSAHAYYNALIWSAPAYMLNLVILGWFLGRGKSGVVLLLSAISNGSNIALNYLLVTHLGWASAGAGSATAISHVCMAVAGVIMVAQELSWKDIRSVAGKVLEPNALRAAIVLNGDILVRTFAMVSTFSLFTNLSSTMGTLTLATHTLLLQVVTLSAYFIDGIAFSTESVAGLLHGQGKRRELMPLLRFAGGVSLIIGLTFASLFNLMPETLFHVLTSHTSVLGTVEQFVPWLFPVLGFGAIAYMLDGYFLGLAEGRTLRNAALWATFVGFLPLGVLGWWWQNPHLLWLGMVAFMATRVLTLANQVFNTVDTPVNVQQCLTQTDI